MFKPLRTERTFEFILQQIKEAIFSGKLNVGDKLPTERELAKTFGASRASVRSAILNLEQAGLVKIKQGAAGGFFVSAMGFKPVRDSLNDLIKLGRASFIDLTEARLILEPQAAGLAAQRATAQDFRRFDEVLLTFAARIRQKVPPHPSDLNFHVCVAEASKNPVIILIMRSLVDLLFQSISSYFLESDKNEEINSQHRRIFKAIKARNSEKAQKLMLEHVKSMEFLFGEFENSEPIPDT